MGFQTFCGGKGGREYFKRSLMGSGQYGWPECKGFQAFGGGPYGSVGAGGDGRRGGREGEEDAAEEVSLLLLLLLLPLLLLLLALQ